ncbi:MAG TPA: helix-turn-helix transcriptional regulator [Caulobacteraceae bacterium]|jgi:DNA-binding NarL/FixJ family response regulator
MSSNVTFLSQFNTRQHEVLMCLLAGDSNREIADYLHLSVSSVERYVSQLIRAAGARDRNDVRVRWTDTVFVAAAA